MRIIQVFVWVSFLARGRQTTVGWFMSRPHNHHLWTFIEDILLFRVLM